jgi:undecaprenyl pyrophosphate synthase
MEGVPRLVGGDGMSKKPEAMRHTETCKRHGNRTDCSCHVGMILDRNGRIEELTEVVRIHHADFNEIKALCRNANKGNITPWDAVRQIDQIVR